MSASETRDQLLAQINSQIVANGQGAITGPVLNNILDSMVLSSIFNAGTWSAFVTYSVLDVVQYGGSSYIATLPSTNQVPPNATYWQILASIGATGPTGPAGPSGGALVTVGTTAVNSGTNSYLLYNNAGTLGNLAASSLTVGAANNVSNGAANQLPYQTGSGATSFISAPSTASTYLQWTGSAFAWAAPPGVTTFSAGTTGLTPNTATSGAVTLSGTLAVANGGTGVTTSTGAGSVVLSSFPTLVSPALGTPVSGVMSNVNRPRRDWHRCDNRFGQFCQRIWRFCNLQRRVGNTDAGRADQRHRVAAVNRRHRQPVGQQSQFRHQRQQRHVLARRWYVGGY